MSKQPVSKPLRLLLPTCAIVVALVLWWVLSATKVFPPTLIPIPADVWAGMGEELHNGRLYNDVIASLFRVVVGLCLGILLGVPCGLLLGHSPLARATFLPGVNFFRSLSPIAWLGFAILWFGIGDVSSIFLIFMATFFPMVLTMLSAVAGIPAIYFRVARDSDLRGLELHKRVTLPAIMPQLVTAFRVTMGIAWVVVVAAEMNGQQVGLGFAINDARNALAPDLLVANMVVIGIVGVLLDQILARLTHIPSLRWGFER